MLLSIPAMMIARAVLERVMLARPDKTDARNLTSLWAEFIGQKHDLRADSPRFHRAAAPGYAQRSSGRVQVGPQWIARFERDVCQVTLDMVGNQLFGF